MTGQSHPDWRAVAVTAGITMALVALCYGVWIGIDMLVRRLAGGTVLTDLRFFVGLMAVFVALTIVDRIVGRVRATLDKKKS